MRRVAHCNRINHGMSVSSVIATGAGESFSFGGNVKEMRDRNARAPDAGAVMIADMPRFS